MKSGEFKAIGYEARLPSNPLSFLPLLGGIQFVFVLFWYSWEISTTARATFSNVIWLSIGVMLISIGFLWISQLFRSQAGTYTASYQDYRDAGGDLRLSYVTPKGRKRTTLEVKNVHAFPELPLRRKVRFGYFDTTLQGTKSSLYIEFRRPRIGLALGFPSRDEMMRVYEVLKIQAQDVDAASS